MRDDRELPMFPLGSVLFPWAPLPLHVFEPRYRALVRDCLAGPAELGVVLIERGSEVGGGDTRFDVGTLARIVQAAELPDGRYVLAVRGERRIRVREWLADDPYPRAVVRSLPDSVGDAAAAAERRAHAERLLTRVFALRAELGEPIPSVEVRLDEDAIRASFEASILAPVGPLDAQRLLELDAADRRLAALVELLVDDAEVCARRLSGT